MIRDILSECANLNSLGIDQEKNGDIESAIKTYEQNIALRYPATHSYDRIIKLYRIKGDYENELRILEIAIKVFTEENERRAELVLNEHPELYNEVMAALEDNINVKFDNGRYAFVQYNTLRYISRLNKVKTLISKQKHP